ncbi:muskelin [Eurytemora carolleeae]|uniref:muskelin n=1 Tax=Eurytemora carolleeae TaxID=1294199 RepID=UPI000C78A0C6|nr:muskelin [Eurytemora carolleeae]|eukprot:XP_023324449.1 muskelin-like [Eurytemora affinis]
MKRFRYISFCFLYTINIVSEKMGKNEHSSELSPGKLTYTIHSCTSHSSSYVAQNILENKPSEQSSRWSSESNHPPQFIVLRLDKPAIVTGILFGKFEKTHVCNLKKFKVFGGLDESSYIELLESGLKNNSSPDSFNLKCELNQHYFPCSFIKIQPIQSWGSSFNFTVWYVELIGDQNPTLVQESIDWQQKNKEREAIRLCLKHFRERNYSEDGDYEGVEELIKECLKNGIFRDYISRQQPKPIWNPLINPDDTILEDIVGPGSAPVVPLSDSESLVSDEERPPPPSLLLTEPPPRGGHQLVMDSTAQSIYLFGGWDGNQDLADFWSYHVPSNRWNLLFPDTESEAGPPPRSCHKMVLDPAYRQIFVLGRYIERTMRVSLSAIKSDFYLFDLVSGRWTQITDDTAAMGGPNLIFDHQMCLDNEHRNIYVFGGQSLHYNNTGEDRSDKRFSGLYVYHINTNTWKLLWEDGQIPAKGPPIISRTGHSMLFNSVDRNLYIFGGQRKRDEYLNDFFTFNVDTHEIKFLSDGITSSGSSIPAVGYTQRATIDCKREEIYVMTGLNKDKEKKSGETGVSNSFWVYEIKPARWSCIYR